MLLSGRQSCAWSRLPSKLAEVPTPPVDHTCVRAGDLLRRHRRRVRVGRQAAGGGGLARLPRRPRLRVWQRDRRAHREVRPPLARLSPHISQGTSSVHCEPCPCPAHDVPSQSPRSGRAPALRNKAGEFTSASITADACMAAQPWSYTSVSYRYPEERAWSAVAASKQRCMHACKRPGDGRPPARRHGFPSDKRLGAGVVDGRSVFSDGAVPANLVSALLAKARPNPAPGTPHPAPCSRPTAFLPSSRALWHASVRAVAGGKKRPQQGRCSQIDLLPAGAAEGLRRLWRRPSALACCCSSSFGLRPRRAP